MDQLHQLKPDIKGYFGDDDYWFVGQHVLGS